MVDTFIPGTILSPGLAQVLLIVCGGLVLISLIIVIILAVKLGKKKKSVDVSALAALASSEPMIEDTSATADPKEVLAILSIERVAASTALSAVKDARKNKRISSKVGDSLTDRYQARIIKIDSDIKRRTGAQEYQSLAQSLEESRDRLIGEVMPSTSPRPTTPISGTPGIPPRAPPVPGAQPPTIPSFMVPTPPSVPSTGPPGMEAHPKKPISPIPTPPKIPAVGPPSAKPTTVIPPSVAPPTISTPPLPPRSTPVIAPPTTGDLIPPPVPTTVSPSTPLPASDSDSQSISGLRMEMLRELARLKKFMSEETQ